MSRNRIRASITVFLAGATALMFPLVGNLPAQEEALKGITVSATDKEAAKQVTNFHRHATPSRTEKGKSASREALIAGGASRHAHEKGGNGKGGNSGNHLVRYQGDLSFEGGPVVYAAESHPIYLQPNGNCPIPACWGDPGGFLKSLGDSDFIHLADQYVGLSANHRYTKGLSLHAAYTPPGVPLTDADLEALVHAAVVATGFGGYTHIYHVFLPPGQDECFDSTFTFCYSPDNPSSFAFCAYHSSVDFQDVGHVLYTVEPFQDVPGCQSVPGTPNGQLVDSTNYALAHETFETITDPDGDAWINFSAVVLAGEEIGDECDFFTVIGTNVYGDPFVYEINGKLYATQPMYSNALHGCSVH
jgi:hypothetical protein